MNSYYSWSSLYLFDLENTVAAMKSFLVYNFLSVEQPFVYLVPFEACLSTSLLSLLRGRLGHTILYFEQSVQQPHLYVWFGAKCILANEFAFLLLCRMLREERLVKLVVHFYTFGGLLLSCLDLGICGLAKDTCWWRISYRDIRI